MLILIFILLIFAGIGYLIIGATAGIVRLFLPRISHIPIQKHRNKSNMKKWMAIMVIFLLFIIICNL